MRVVNSDPIFSIEKEKIYQYSIVNSKNRKYNRTNAPSTPLNAFRDMSKNSNIYSLI